MFNKKKSENYKALFVDLDGTLADSMEFLLNTFHKFLAEWEVKATAENFQEYIGVPLEEIVRRLIKEHKRSEDLAIELQRYRRLLMDFPIHAKPFSDAQEVLQKQKSHGKIIGLVTSAEQHTAELFVSENHLDGIFNVIVGSKAGTKGKPDPQLYIEALKLTETLPEDALAIEDSIQGLMAASLAGIPAIQYLRADQHPEHGYTAVHSWKELGQILERR